MLKFIITLLAVVVVLALSWGMTCGIIWLICFCFHFKFGWMTETGIWLVLMLLSSFFRSSGGSKK